MRLMSVNVSLPRTVRHQGRSIPTGIFKKPVPGRTLLRQLNLDGDGQADLRVHGGPDKAVCVYPLKHYDFWRRELKRHVLDPGYFGENFTVDGLLEENVHIGDIFRVGQALVQVTQPRVPCFKLAMKLELPGFPRQFLESRRSGFYLRVLEEGEVGPGDAILRVKIDPGRVSVRQVFELAFFDLENVKALRQALRVAALAASWREDFQSELDKTERRSRSQP